MGRRRVPVADRRYGEPLHAKARRHRARAHRAGSGAAAQLPGPNGHVHARSCERPGLRRWCGWDLERRGVNGGRPTAGSTPGSGSTGQVAVAPPARNPARALTRHGLRRRNGSDRRRPGGRHPVGPGPGRGHRQRQPGSSSRRARAASGRPLRPDLPLRRADPAQPGPAGAEREHRWRLRGHLHQHGATPAHCRQPSTAPVSEAHVASRLPATRRPRQVRAEAVMGTTVSIDVRPPFVDPAAIEDSRRAGSTTSTAGSACTAPTASSAGRRRRAGARGRQP